ncbi:MAG: hypothetical protein ACMUIU_17125 [bacterium]
MKAKMILIILSFLILSFTAVDLIQGELTTTGEAVWEVTTDKFQYYAGETVYITATNVGTGPGYVRFCHWVFLEVKRPGNGPYVKMQDPRVCLAMSFPVYPGESIHTMWDQTYFIVEDRLRIVPPTGEQVPNGAYVIRLYNGEAKIVIKRPPAR